MCPGKMISQTEYKEAIVLAGGRGTRLQSVVSDVPKPMADVGGRPFLTYILDYLITQGITRTILSVGYKHEYIETQLGSTYRTLSLVYAVETTPLGTGGAISNSLKLATTNHVWVVNGDTYLPASFQKLAYVHQRMKSAFSLFLREVDSDGRYGGVQVDKAGVVTQFTAKGETGRMLVNAGTYLVERLFFLEWARDLEQFSLEDLFFASPPVPLVGVSVDNYFIDIGIPDDYKRAQIELSALPISRTYNTLFLDRDGVLNKRVVGGYVTKWSEFELLPGVLQGLALVNHFFREIIIVTNQRGISRGLVSEATVQSIHSRLIELVAEHGGKIDKVYTCPCADCDCRKPNTGMALTAQQDFPLIRFNESLLVGDSLSDLNMAKQLAITAVYITGGGPLDMACVTASDEIYDNFEDWSSHYYQTYAKCR